MRWMIPLLLCALAPSLSLASVDTDGDGLTDDYEMGYGRYQVIEGSFTWHQAKADAEAKGGHLATITSESEWNVIRQQFTIQLTLEALGGKHRLYIGGTDQEVEAAWGWVTNEAWRDITDFWWSTNPSNDNGAEHYLELLNGKYQGYASDKLFVNDIVSPFSEVGGYLLEFGYPTDPSKADTDSDGYDDKVEGDFGSDPNDPNAIPAEYEITLAAGAHRFEVVEGPYTWHQAEADAVERGGRLAVFPTDGLYDRIIAKVRQSFAGVLWLGLTDEAQEGLWRWIDGSLLTYSRWHWEEPNNLGNEDYAAVMDGGRTTWNDGGTTWLQPYLLEHRPTTILALPWSQGGQAWTVDAAERHDDVSSAKAQTTNGQSTYREYTVVGPAAVDFWWKVSSQQGADYFSYSLNGVSREAISGEVDWTHRMLLLPAGTHTIRWTYAKDDSGTVGQDAGWLDSFSVRVLDPNGDEDNDGLNNTEETNLGTNPYLRDTDSDGVNDQREALDHTDPLDPASFNPLNLGLVAYYPFNANAKDESGNGNHGSTFEVTLAPDRKGASNSAYSFNGVTSFISAQNTQALSSFAGEMSVSCWVRFQEPNRGGWRNLISKYRATTDSPDNGFLLRTATAAIRPQVLYAELGGQQGDTASYGKDFVGSEPTWAHILAVAKGGQTTLYYNGKQVASGFNAGAFNNDDPLTIGGQNENFNARQHLGQLDEVRVYNRALTAKEVAFLYASDIYEESALQGAATMSPFDPATAANWDAGGIEWTVDTSVTHDGLDSVKAQATDGQSTYREYTLTGPAVVDFWWKVSSEQLYDTFSYSLNGVNQETISGEVDWTYRTLTLPAGAHTIRWTYTKDGSDAVGQDAGWLDDFAVYPATATLQVRDGATVLSGTTTVDFGSADLGSTGFTKTLTFANDGYIPLEVQLSLPQGSPFTFDGGVSTYGLFLGRGESVGVPIRLATTAAGNKSAQLTISAPDSTVAPPSVTLTGFVLGPDIGLAQGATTLTSGQTFDMGLAPRTVEFTIRNNGNVSDLVISAISATGNFQITQQPATTIPPQGSTTFKVLAQSTASGMQAGSISITSNAANSAEFSLLLSSKSFTGIAQGIADGSITTSGTGGAVGWDFAATQLPSGQNGQALKTGTTPNNGGSVLEFTTQTAGVLSWSWKVGSQENFDWLVCEVDGQEAAGISTKNGEWQTQVVQVSAGANVRWVYRKDASASAGEDAGYLADVEFRSFAANQSFSQWADTLGIYDPQQRLSKSGMKAKFAWLGSIDPAVGPDAGHYVPIMEGGRLKYRFPISKTADGTQQILYSPDMASWTTRRFSQRMVSEDADRMVIEATAPSGTKGFFKVVGSGDASMVWVEGGTLPQTSELAGTAVSTFQIGKTEVTWAEWQQVRSWAVVNGYDLAGVGQGSAPDHPVRNVSWYDAVKWCNARSEKEGLEPVYVWGGSYYRQGQRTPTVVASAKGYRLPTQAEWEWAARGGAKSQGYLYSGSNDVNAVAWHAFNSGNATKAVRTRAANELGLYDMSGNIWEWCLDPNWSGTGRHIRGGSWSSDTGSCAVAYSGFIAPGNAMSDHGLRVARNAD